MQYTKKMKIKKPIWPLVVLLFAMAAVYYSGVYQYFSFDSLKDYHDQLEEFKKTHFSLLSLFFILSYITIVTLSIPVGFFFSLLSGYLFPQPLSVLYVVCGATTGGSLVFLAVSTALRPYLKKQARPFLKKMEKGFQKNAANYLLFLRFLPFFPFWAVNLVPAFLGVRFKTFLWTTFVGVIPGALILTLAGRGLHNLLESDEPISITNILNPELKVALVLLALVSILPIVIKKKR